ncbi:MAG: serine hydrolase [Balneolaceae bacterium]
MIVKTFPGRAIDITVNSDGNIYCIGKSSKKVFEWSLETDNWDVLPDSPSEAIRITADRRGILWVVHEDRTISRKQSKSWKKVNGRAIDIAAAARTNDVFCVGLNQRVYQWNESSNDWTLFDDSPSGIRAVAAENTNELWAILSNRNMVRFRNNVWSSIPGQALDISSKPGANNSAFVVGRSRRLFDWNEVDDNWDLTSEMSHSGFRIAAEPSGDVIVVDINGKINRVSTRLTFYNRFVPQEAHEQMGAFVDQGKGIRCFAFTSEGKGWVLISSENDVFAHNIPNECLEKLKEVRDDDVDILWVAFSPKGGDRWSIVTERGFFNSSNIPDELNQRMTIMQENGHKLKCVAFPPADGNRWLVITNKGFFARNIPDECYQIIRNINAGQRQVHQVAFEPDGGWLVLADDYYFARNIDHECFDKLKAFQRSSREISLVTFDMNRRGWSIISNERRNRVTEDLPRRFELQFPSGSIWQSMRDQNVVGAAVAVVENNQISWAGGYGHIKTGEDHAVHPETLFQAASISKPITALGILCLVQNGDLELDDDVTDIIDSDDWTPIRTSTAIQNNVRLSINTDPDTCTTANDGGCQNAVTIRRLMSNSAGTTIWGFDGFASGPFPSTNQILNGQAPAKEGPVQISYTPGTDAIYSGGSNMVLQKVIEEVTGMNFRRWMQNNVLNPLGMNDSFFGLTVPSQYVRDNNAAVAHRRNGTTFNVDRFSYPAFAAAGLYTNVLDLSRVIIMINQGGMIDGDQFLQQNLINTMLTQQHLFNDRVGARIGLDFYLNPGNDSTDPSFNYRKGGSNIGFNSEMRGYPNRNAGVVALVNRHRSSFDNQIVRAVASTYNW